MLTSALITLTQKQFPDWSRQLLLDFINEIQRMVYTQQTVSSMKMFSSTTGRDPILTTVSGTYSYNINVAGGFEQDAWRVCNVYSNDISDSSDVLMFDATPVDPAKVVFKDNPSGVYYIRAYRFPTSITSESIQMTVPHAYHITHIYEGLCGMIEQFRSGKSERWMNFEKGLLPDLVKKLSTDFDYYVKPRGF